MTRLLLGGSVMVLVAGCGDHDGTFKGTFSGGVTNADLSERRG